MTQPPNSGQWGPPQGQGGFGPPHNQGGFGPPQGQGGFGPPQGQQGQWGPPPPPKKKHTVRNVILAVIGVIVVISIATSAGSGSSDDTTAKQQTEGTDTGKSDDGTKSSTDKTDTDAQIVSCGKDGTTGFPVAKVKVTNSSSKSSNYIVTVSFNNGSEQLDTGLASANNLNPGSSTTQEAASLKSDVPSGFTCKIEDTTRYSAVG